MYGDNQKSGEVMLEIIKNNKMLKKITKLCDITWEEGLKKRAHGPNNWSYNGMLRDLGRKIEEKTGRKLIAGSLMHENAEKMGLLIPITKVVSNAKKIGTEKGYYGASLWTEEGLLQSLGNEIELIEGNKLPKLRDEEYYEES
ncbi:hypothetical protein LI82_02670 [Methanococcoides methylutens]|uniref:Uncharacterized protein n=1 Tax=Methanococcoides methylutens TaxID=2226 RepID=A0A099T445_METMT|nr:hypothetical protein [Methanococcoides methylutens]KGK98963.1 hypothetical protein LI82_02670 [Methanococcoides methylutens]